MASDSSVKIKILGDNSDFIKAINSTEASVKSLQGILAKLGLSVSVGAVVKEVVSNTSELETALSNVSTLFGGVSVDMDKFTSKILELSKETGRSASAIASAVYQAESSGVEVTEDMGTMMEFMSSATKLSVAGFTSVENAVDSLAKIQNAYGKEVLSTEQISKNLVMTQNLGITTVDQLSQSLANVTPTASAFGVSLENIGASLSVMTKAGTDTATATTQLNMLISSLAKSDTEASKNLKKATKEITGQEKSFQDLIAEGKNLQEILGYMKTYADNAGLSIVDLFTEMNAGKGALQIVSDSTQTFTEYLKQMTSEADIVQETYDKVMNTRAQSWSKLANRLKNITINIGMSQGSQTIIDSVYNLAENVVTKLEDWEPTISRAINATTVISSVFFNYLKTNIESIPKWIAEALVAKSLLSSLTSALGLTKLTTGVTGLAIGLEILDGINGTKSWEQVGSDLVKALAVGMGVGSFAGANTGSLAFSLTLMLDLDFEDLGEKAGEIGDTLFDKIGSSLSSVFDEGSFVRDAIQNFFDWMGDLWNASVSSIGTLFEGLFNGDIRRSWQKAIDKFAMMWAKLFDMLKGGTTYQDMLKVSNARRDVGTASFFTDEDLLKYIKEAEAQNLDLEEHLKEIYKTQNENAKEEISPILGVNTQALEKQLDDLTEQTIKDLTNGITGVKKDPVQNQKNWSNIQSSYESNVLGIGFDETSLEDLKSSLNDANSIIETATEDMREQVKEAFLSMGSSLDSAISEVTPMAEDIVDGFLNGLSLKELKEIGEKLGLNFVEGAKDSLGIHSPSKVFEEIGQNIVKGLENGLTESELEKLETDLNEAYAQLGAEISQALAIGFDEDGNAYSITDAIRDIYEGSKKYMSLGKQADSIQIRETPSTPQRRTTGGGGNNAMEGWTLKDGKWVEDKESGLAVLGQKIKEVWEGLGKTITDTEKTGFDAVSEISSSLMNLTSSVSDYFATVYDSQITALEEARDTAKENGKLTIQEEKEMDAQIKALKKKQFESQKRSNIGEALMNGAVSIMNIWKDWGGQPIVAGVLTALAGATMMAQVATINSQQSGYESGGLIGGHGYTGDKQQIWANAGELILNRAQQRTIADQLSYGGNTTVIQVEFSGNVFGDQQTVAEYVYEGIKTAQAQGALKEW